MAGQPFTLALTGAQVPGYSGAVSFNQVGHPEAAVNGATPDAAKITDYLNRIVKECGGMSAMSAKGKPE